MASRLRELIVIACLLCAAVPLQAQMADPSIDRPDEPFSYFSKPTDVLGVMDAREGTLVTPEGYLYTGFGELMFFTGNPPEPVNQRVKTLKKGYLPIVQYDFGRQGFTYSFTMFAATLDGMPAGPLVNFVQVHVRNNVPRTSTAFFSLGVRYQNDVNTETGTGDNRFRRPATAARLGEYSQAGVEFSPKWRYGFAKDAFIRDGKVMYLYPSDAQAERMFTLKGSSNDTLSTTERSLSILPTTPVGIVQYRITLAPGKERVLEFRMPYDPIPADDPRAASLRSASFDEALGRTEKFWDEILAKGIEISVPETKPVDTFKASLVYDLIARDQVGGDYIQTVNKFRYHAFWLRDASYIARMYDISGYSNYARQVLDFFARWQTPDGNFVSQGGQFDGWGQTLWAYGQHYRIAKDIDFAAKVYPSVEKAVEWLKAARRSDPLGLMPATTPGDNELITGHVTGHNFWALAGLQNAISLARALGKDKDEQDYRREYDDYRAALLRALAHITIETGGYMPPGLDRRGGQDWGNLESVYPETILDPFDPMVTATLATTQAKYQEGIMTYGDGWWLHHYLTTMNTETELVRGEQQRVIGEFYALLLHTSSTHAGFETNIQPWGTRDFGSNLSPHGWFAAKFRTLMRDMFVCEQANDLHLLSAISPDWVREGRQITVRRAPTNFGQVNYRVEFSQAGAEFTLENHFTSPPEQIVLHIPWFVKVTSVVADGARLQVEGSIVRLPPHMQRIQIVWKRLPLTKPLSFEQAVRDYELDYKRHYDAFPSTGGSLAAAPPAVSGPFQNIPNHNPTPLPPSNGLIHYWNLDQAPGSTTAVDSIGGANVTLAGTAEFSTSSEIGSGALSLPPDGTSKCSGITTPADMLGQSQLTLSMWYKRACVGCAVETGQELGDDGEDIAIQASFDGNLYVGIGGNGASTESYASITQNDTDWHLATLVFDGTLTGDANRLKLYLDGVQQTLGSFNRQVPASTTTVAQTFYIGATDCGQMNDAGSIDDVRVYNRALSATEVSNLYKATYSGAGAVTVPAAGPQAGGRMLGDVSSFEKRADGVVIQAQGGKVSLTVLSPTAVRVHYLFQNESSGTVSFAALPGAFHGSNPRLQIENSADTLSMGTGALTVRVYKSPLRVAFLSPTGALISEDQPGMPATFQGSAFRVWKAMPEDEHYFGLGDKSGPMDHRNLAFTLWNTDAFRWQESTDPLYKSIPFILAFRNGISHGIFLDNTYRSRFDFGKERRDVYSFGADGGDLDYYFFYGPEPKRVTEQFTELVGRMPLPPLFALGYQQSRMHDYYPESKVREVAAEFRKRKIPADVIYLDLDYQKFFTVDRRGFPSFEGMVKDLRDEGFKIVYLGDFYIVSQPGYQPYDEGVKSGYFLKNADGSLYVGKVWPGVESVFPDFTREEVRRWWGTLYSDFVQDGIRGFWNDMNEPSVSWDPTKTVPLDVVHRVEGRKTDHREIHNVFGMENDRATYEGLLRLQPNLRPFVLTRAAFAGTERYAATWTGDNSATWNHMRISVPQLINLGLSGYAFVGADIGGFSGNPTPELLTRWMELGAFNPMYRNHSSKGTRLREPWVDGPEHESIRRHYIETRYRLLPYIYTSMEETARTGVPLMRPLFLEFPDQADLALNDEEFMFGRSLLVAPKVWDDWAEYTISLPVGEWFDYWTGAKVTGGRYLEANPSLGTLPVYVRAGSIIPRQPVVQDVDEVPRGPLVLDIYPGPQCQGSLYADDGNTLAYQHGDSMRLEFACEVGADHLDVDISAPTGPYQPWFDQLQLDIYGVSGAVKAVIADSRPVTGWKLESGVVTLPPLKWERTGHHLKVELESK